MLKRTLIAAGLATAMAAGTLTAGTAPASAGGYGSGYVGGNGWYLGWGHQKPWVKPHHYFKPPMRKVCQPVYKKIKVYHRYYGWVWQTVYAGQTCGWKPAYRHW